MLLYILAACFAAKQTVLIKTSSLYCWNTPDTCDAVVNAFSGSRGLQNDASDPTGSLFSWEHCCHQRRNVEVGCTYQMSNPHQCKNPDFSAELCMVLMLWLISASTPILWWSVYWSRLVTLKVKHTTKHLYLFIYLFVWNHSNPCLYKSKLNWWWIHFRFHESK